MRGGGISGRALELAGWGSSGVASVDDGNVDVELKRADEDEVS